jgi:hypothetical protein
MNAREKKVEQTTIVLMIELEKIHICDTDLDLNRRSTRF